MQSAQFLQTADRETRHWWFVARREMLCQVVARLLKNVDRPLAIDVGCGTGANAAALAEHCETVGIDPSAEATRLASERYPHVQFVCGHAPDDLGPLAGRANLFVLADVLEHVADDRELLANLASRARPDAHFLITVPADERLWSPHDDSHGHFRRYDCESLAALWHGLPLAVVGVTPFNSRLYPLIRAARRLSALRGRAWGPADTDLALPPRWLNGISYRVFLGESSAVLRAAAGEGPARYRRGVSLLAVLKKVENAPPGEITGAA